MVQLKDNNENNNDVQFCNTTNLNNELQKNLEENENNMMKISQMNKFTIMMFN